MLYPATSLWAIALLRLSSFVYGQDNYFVNPPSAGPNAEMPTDEDLSENTVYSLGQVVTLEWVANFSETDVGVWYYPGNTQGGWGIGIFNLTSDTHTRTLNWTVGPPKILEESGGRGNVFWINVYQNGPPWISLNSRTFNVTNSSDSISTTSSTWTTIATTTLSTTTGPSQSQVTTVTTVATQTISSQSNSSGFIIDDRKSLAIGLGVGLGLGIPLALVIVILLLWYCISNPRRDTVGAVTDSTAETVRMDILDPPPKYRPHELTAKEQHQELKEKDSWKSSGLIQSARNIG